VIERYSGTALQHTAKGYSLSAYPCSAAFDTISPPANSQWHTNAKKIRVSKALLALAPFLIGDFRCHFKASGDFFDATSPAIGGCQIGLGAAISLLGTFSKPLDGDRFIFWNAHP